MSGNRLARKSSPSSTSKQGPMRATLPMSSLLRQGSSLRKSKSNSPTLSPTSAWRTRISPESSLSGQRSPGSLHYKAKSKTLNSRTSQGFGGSNVIRRTASLDTIYLNGQWPRESFYMYCGQLLVDKATQTDEWTSEQRKLYRYADAACSAADEAKLEKIMRHRLQRNNKEAGRTFNLILAQPNTPAPSDNTCLSQPSTGTNTPSPGVNIPLGAATARPPMRSSIEGLNQEIERLVLKPHHVSGREEEKSYQATPEGHRAPLADLLRSTRSVNTQTPAERDLSSRPESPAGLATSDLHSQGSTPDHDLGKLATSPHINKFLAREPPDGCEKISSKFVEDSRLRPMVDLSKFQYCPLKPCINLKPSLGSAFYPLQQASRSVSTGAINGECSSLDDSAAHDLAQPSSTT